MTSALDDHGAEFSPWSFLLSRRWTARWALHDALGLKQLAGPPLGSAISLGVRPTNLLAAAMDRALPT